MSDIKVTNLDSQHLMVINKELHKTKLGTSMAEAFPKISIHIAKSGEQPHGMPLTIYNKMSSETMNVDMCIPVSKKMDDNNDIVYKLMPACKAVKYSYFGPYAELDKGYEAVQAYIKENSLQIAGAPWEQYVNDPTGLKPEEIQTNIYFPIK